jgi:predicted secreted protein
MVIIDNVHREEININTREIMYDNESHHPLAQCFITSNMSCHEQIYQHQTCFAKCVVGLEMTCPGI